ncbi:MAG: hypothetical protein Q8S01_12775, partial [Ignavibacteria bacterium]|nr:hypothetical protein [Ignavibacteria bacterium]
MKKNKYFVVIMLLCSWSFTSFTFAQSVNKVGTSGATFLRIPVGAQAIGMGSAYVSMMNDPSSLYWNPAATASIKANTLLVDHALWLPGIYFDFIGLTIPLADFGTTGLSLGIMHTNDMEIT